MPIATAAEITSPGTSLERDAYATGTRAPWGNGTGGGLISAQPGGRILLIFTRLVSPTPEARRAPSNAFNSENPSDEPLTRKNFVGV